MAIYNKSYIDDYFDSVSFINESEETTEMLVSFGILAVLCAAKLVKKLPKMLKDSKNEKIQKQIENFIKNTKEMKDAINELNRFGENGSKKIVSQLKQYRSKNKLKDISRIEYDPFNGFDISIEGYIDDDNWDDYCDLLDFGEDIGNKIFDSENKENKYDIGISSKMFDTIGVIYVEVYLSNKYKDELCREIKEKYKDEIKEICNKRK